LNDSYSYTGSWNETVGTDGTLTYNSTLSNTVSGSRSIWSSWEDEWETTVTYHGSSSGGGDYTSTESGSSSGSSPPSPESYSYTLDDSGGFYQESYTGQSASLACLPCTGTTSYTIPGDTSGEDPASDPGTSGTSTSTDPTTGEVFLLLSGGDGDGESYIVDWHGTVFGSRDWEPTFQEIIDSKKELPGVSRAPSPYDELFDELVGEALDGLIGGEALADATDYDSFFGDMVGDLTQSIGARFGGPGAALRGMAIDPGAGGASMAAGYSIVHGLGGGSAGGGSTYGTFRSGTSDATLTRAAFGTDAPGISTSTASTRPETYTVSQTDDLGNTCQYQYDTNGRLIKLTEPDPDGDGPLGPLVTTFEYDDHGNLIQINYPDGTSESCTYDDRGQVTSYTDGLGRLATYTTDPASGQVASVTLVVGQDDATSGETDDVTYQFTYTDGSGLLPRGLILTETDPLGRQTVYTYDDGLASHDFGQLIAITYAFGTADEATIQFEYDDFGTLCAQIDELGRRTEFTYDALGRVLSVTLPDPDGEGPLKAPVTHYQYDDAAGTVTVIDPLGNVIVQTYDADDRLVETLLPDPDGEGPLASPVTSFSYDADGNLTSSVDPLGRTTQYAYDALGQLILLTQPDPDGEGPLAAPTTSYTYDPAGNVASVTDASGAVTRLEYDEQHRLIRVIEPDPDGEGPLESPVTQAQYDAAGQLTAVIDPLGRVTTYTYDDLGRRIGMTLPDPDGDGPLTAPQYTYTFDAVGNLISETDPEGHVTQYEYDNRDRLIRVIGPTGQTTEYQYDAAGQLIAVTDPLSQVTTFTYDDLGRRIAMTLPDPDGEGPLPAPEYVYSYDAVGNLLSQTDPEGNVTGYEYDPLGRLVRQVDAAGDATEYAFDAAGNLLSLTDPVGNTTTWVYDGLDRVVEETNQLGYSRYYAYDAAGNLVEYTDRNGRVTEYDYDALSRLVEERWLDGQTVVCTIAYAYDAAGQLVGVDDAEADYSYQYDALGRVTSSSLDLAGLGQTVTLSYAYDLAGRRTELSAQIGATQDFVNTYAYNSSGRLVRVEQSGEVGGNAVAEKRVDFAYDAQGRTTAITRYADLAGTQLVADTTFTYDSAGRLTELMHCQDTVDLAGYTWTYDSAGRITQFTSLLDGTVDYTHDATGQLTGADYDYQDDESYTYDENGNRIGGGYVVGTNNQLLSDGTFWYEYDAEGNRTLRYVWTDTDTDGQVDPGEQSQITEYVWDHRNRLVRVTERDTDTGPATKVVEHTYDYLNRWVGRSVDPDGDGPLGFDDTYFVYDGTPSGDSLLGQVGQIVLQFDADAQGDPQLTHRYLWGAAVDQILADEQVTSLTSPGEILWPLTDHLNTVRDLAVYDPETNLTTIANHLVYDAYGRLTSQTDPAITTLFGFTARPFDPATGLQNNLNRWYDAKIGRWLSEDPIGFEAGDANLYRYVGNSPTNLTDPAGLDWRTNLKFLWDFLTGSGDDVRIYSQNEIELEEMKKSAGAEKLRNEFYRNLCRDTWNVNYGTGQAFVDTTIVRGTWFTDTPDQVGGFGGASATINPDGTVTFTIPNTAGRNSFLYHTAPDRPLGSTGPMRTIQQTFQWTERIDPQRRILNPRSRIDPIEWGKPGAP